MERASARIASSPCKQTFTPAEVFGIQLGNNDATVALEMQQLLPSSVEDRARILFETWRSQLCGSAGRHGHLCFDVLAGKFFESRRVFFCCTDLSRMHRMGAPTWPSYPLVIST
jgi:hypothetical protein